MQAPKSITLWREDDTSASWSPTTLDQLGKSEEFLEVVLADSPDLLNLASRRSGIHGPYRVFRQLPLSTPNGRTIFPDIVLLSDSGHLVVVEVKLSSNQELRDRRVIAQIIDYAASFAELPEEALTSLFAKDSVASTWEGLIADLFGDQADRRELATTLRERISAGEITLVIACDQIPPGLPDLVRGIVNQRSLGFSLDVVEVVPYVRSPTPQEDILFVPLTRPR